MGFSPQEIERMEAERLQEAMLAAILAPLSVQEGGQVSIARGVTYTEQGVLPGGTGNATAAPASQTPAAAGPAAGTQSRSPVKRGGPAPPGGGRTGPKPSGGTSGR